MSYVDPHFYLNAALSLLTRVAYILIASSSLTLSNSLSVIYFIMSFKPALVVVDMQEDFCPPVGHSRCIVHATINSDSMEH
jgi:hypothetical protein